jgi:hypothetical protein
LAFVHQTKAVHVNYFNDVSIDTEIPDEDLLRLILSESEQPEGGLYPKAPRNVMRFMYFIFLGRLEVRAEKG